MIDPLTDCVVGGGSLPGKVENSVKMLINYRFRHFLLMVIERCQMFFDFRPEVLRDRCRREFFQGQGELKERFKSKFDSFTIPWIGSQDHFQLPDDIPYHKMAGRIGKAFRQEGDRIAVGFGLPEDGKGDKSHAMTVIGIPYLAAKMGNHHSEVGSELCFILVFTENILFSDQKEFVDLLCDVFLMIGIEHTFRPQKIVNNFPDKR